MNMTCTNLFPKTGLAIQFGVFEPTVKFWPQNGQLEEFGRYINSQTSMGHLDSEIC